MQANAGESPKKKTTTTTLKNITRLCKENPFKRKELPNVLYPTRPVQCKRQSVSSHLKALQKYISAFEYNFLPRCFFNTNKHRPLTRIMDTCREVIKEALPIRCLEAAFLTIFLTQTMPELDRIPLAFKTEFGGNIYRHIVIIIRHEDKYGALGLSRKDDLMYKPLHYQSMSALMKDYKESYERYHHTVHSFKIGLPVTHDSSATAVPCWKFFAINARNTAWKEVEKIVNNYAGMASKLTLEWEKSNTVSKQRKKYLRSYTQELNATSDSSTGATSTNISQKQQKLSPSSPTTTTASVQQLQSPTTTTTANTTTPTTNTTTPGADDEKKSFESACSPITKPYPPPVSPPLTTTARISPELQLQPLTPVKDKESSIPLGRSSSNSIVRRAASPTTPTSPNSPNRKTLLESPNGPVGLPPTGGVNSSVSKHSSNNNTSHSKKQSRHSSSKLLEGPLNHSKRPNGRTRRNSCMTPRNTRSCYTKGKDTTIASSGSAPPTPSTPTSKDKFKIGTNGSTPPPLSSICVAVSPTPSHCTDPNIVSTPTTGSPVQSNAPTPVPVPTNAFSPPLTTDVETEIGYSSDFDELEVSTNTSSVEEEYKEVEEELDTVIELKPGAGSVTEVTARADSSTPQLNTSIHSTHSVRDIRGPSPSPPSVGAPSGPAHEVGVVHIASLVSCSSHTSEYRHVTTKTRTPPGGTSTPEVNSIVGIPAATSPSPTGSVGHSSSPTPPSPVPHIGGGITINNICSKSVTLTASMLKQHTHSMNTSLTSLSCPSPFRGRSADHISVLSEDEEENNMMIESFLANRSPLRSRPHNFVCSPQSSTASPARKPIRVSSKARK